MRSLVENLDQTKEELL